MKFDYVNRDWLYTASEEELRTTLSKMENTLEHFESLFVEYHVLGNFEYDPDEHTRLCDLHTNLVNAIARRFQQN